MRRPLLIPSVLAALALAGCGAVGGDGDRPNADATLLIDGRPNALHTGIYLADRRGFTEAEGVDLDVAVPEPGADRLDLLDRNRAQFALVGLHDLALARERGQELVAVLAIVQRPLEAVLARKGLRGPRELDGRRIGVDAGRDAAIVESVVRSGYRRVAPGPDRVAALLAGRIDATFASWAVGGVAAREREPDTEVLRVDDAGAPRFPGLVLATKQTTIDDSPAVVQATVTALRRGYREVVLGPEEAVGVLVDRVDGLDRATVQAQLDALSPSLTAGGQPFGALDPAALGRWAAWEEGLGVVRERPDPNVLVDATFTRQGVISG